jgi:hypothetical protein
MTEQEWLEAIDPMPMVKYLRRRKASVRKWRLVAVACCRRRWPLITDERCRYAVLTAERFADGEVSKAAMTAAHKDAYELYCEDARDIFDSGRDALGAAAGAAMTIPGHAFNRATYRMEPSEICGLLREVFGNPFRPITINPAWLTWHDGLLLSIAKRMYDSREFSDMPVLADALEEAGYQDQDILGHCRSGGEHVRGCWVIDSLLGKQ